MASTLSTLGHVVSISPPQLVNTVPRRFYHVVLHHVVSASRIAMSTPATSLLRLRSTSACASLVDFSCCNALPPWSHLVAIHLDHTLTKLYTLISNPHLFIVTKAKESSLASIMQFHLSFTPHLGCVVASPRLRGSLTSVARQPHLGCAAASPRLHGSLTSVARQPHLGCAAASPHLRGSLTTVARQPHLVAAVPRRI
ncbi:unnamed protein product [Arabis nemorensis]|uniref:Uncharacterized protein n=1 Tax=Arabis nemorensis TaxID=586526 RepID=A0A565BGV5_9BRAS|nr:unnamed protein product [Arabis nemorensis]